MMVDLRVMTQSSTEQAVTETAQGLASASAAIGESLSALVDSEASEMEVRRILKNAETDPEIRERWKRYHLMRSVLQGDLDVNPQIDLSGRISAAIAQEESLQVPDRFKQWRDGLGKVAIAASVAFAFVFGVQQLGPVGEPAATQMSEAPQSALTQPAAANANANSVPTGFELPSLSARTVSTGSGSNAGDLSEANPYIQALNVKQGQDTEVLQQHFNQLLIKHAERSSTSGSMGLLPFARVSEMGAVQE